MRTQCMRKIWRSLAHCSPSQLYIRTVSTAIMDLLLLRWAWEDFAACGRRGPFCPARKSPKSRQGAVQMGTSCPYSRPPGPRYGGRAPERLFFISGAQNQECLPAFSSGPLGPGCAKFVPGAVFALRLGFLSQRSRCKIAFPLQGGRWLAVGHTDEGALLDRNSYSHGRPQGSPL